LHFHTYEDNSYSEQLVTSKSSERQTSVNNLKPWFMFKRLYLLALILSTGCISCQTSKILVTGKVERIMGNQMPSPDVPIQENPGVSVPIYFFEPIDMQKVTPGVGIGEFTSVIVAPIRTVQSAKDGRFKLKLPAGRYSVLLGKNGQYYSTVYDLDGTINPIVVEKGKKNEWVFRADWEATY
jgi:hypothetical protein